MSTDRQSNQRRGSDDGRPPHLQTRLPAADDPSFGLRLPRPVRQFLATETAGGIVLLAAAVIAMVWANSPWRDSYHHLITLPIDIEIGAVSFHTTVEHFVAEGLMALFFFVVGLEIKREFVGGELRSWRAASLPVLCAIGGMVVPAAIFVLINRGQPGAGGWGIPMATDIAFALGVVALLSHRVPPALKLFLLTLAVVDDLGAIVVIALVYSPSIDLGALAIAGVLLVVVLALRLARIVWWPAYVLPVAGVWLATQASGVHATIAGVALAMVVSTTPRTPGEVVQEWQVDLTDDMTPADVALFSRVARSAVSPAERLEHALHPAVSFVVVPLFALVSAGVTLTGDLFDQAPAMRVALGVVAGLVVGKAVGITLAAGLAVRTRVASLPPGVGWHHLLGVASVAGIGFTVSLFVSGLAYTDPALVDAAKLAVLVASVTAALVGTLVILTAPKPADGGAPAVVDRVTGPGTAR